MRHFDRFDKSWLAYGAEDRALPVADVILDERSLH